MNHFIRLDAEGLQFAAAHFATFGDDLEPLHGHNYRVIAEVSGTLTGDAWIIDFGRAKRVIREICAELDHRFLLQGSSPELRAVHENGEWLIEWRHRRYVMPEEDVVSLPINNTTAERLAEWLAGRLAGVFRGAGDANVNQIRVGVEEAPGQSGWCSLSIS